MPRWTPPPLFPDRRTWLYMLGLGGRKGRATIRRRGLLDSGLSDAEFHERVLRLVGARGRHSGADGNAGRRFSGWAVRRDPNKYRSSSRD